MTTRKSKPDMPPEPPVAEEMYKASKIRLIRKFQRMEGNYDCCASAYIRVCHQLECLWRDDCMAMAKD